MPTISGWDGRLEFETQELVDYLRVDVDNVDLITDLAISAIEKARVYLNNEFVNDDYEIQLIPNLVKTAVFKMVSSWYETRRDDISGASMGGMNESYGEMPHSAKNILDTYRLLPGI